MPSEHQTPPKHEDHPDCPDTLDCLPDTEGRPQHTLPIILRCAILGSPHKRLTIRDIYAAMEEKYPYYKTAGPAWKQSVRHHLSLNRLFERRPRPATEPGFGSYWTVNLSAPPGTKRPRRRGRQSKSAEDDNAPAAVKRRGRPRRSVLEDEPPSPTVVEPVRKCPFTRENKPPAPEEMLLDSENDYESEEEDGLYPYIPPVVKAFNRVHPSSPASYALWTPATFGGDHPYLRELFDLRRRKLELETRTIDLSDQLAAARAESSRARAAQRAIESMLEAEQKKRARAERVANEESKLRRAAEDALGRACTAEGTAMMA